MHDLTIVEAFGPGLRQGGEVSADDIDKRVRKLGLAIEHERIDPARYRPRRRCIKYRRRAGWPPDQDGEFPIDANLPMVRPNRRITASDSSI